VYRRPRRAAIDEVLASTRAPTRGWTEGRALAAARLRGAPGRLCQADSDTAVTSTGFMPQIDAVFRHRLQQLVAEQLAIVAAERGLAIDSATKDHAAARWHAWPSGEFSNSATSLTIEGREYRRCLPAAAA
jgi:hypothetical protein